MAVSDGDPRTFDPELFQRLAVWERHYAVRCYSMRLNQVGRGKPNYPDDESPASVARQAVIYGFVFLGLGLFGALVSLVIFTALVGVWWGPAARVAIDVGLGTVIAAAVVAIPCTLRARQVSGYYLARYPDSLNRWFFKPGFDPASTDAPQDVVTERTSTPQEAVGRGDPTVVAPEVMAAPNRWERSQVAGLVTRYPRRAGVSDGDPRTFDPELFQRLAAWERHYAVRCYSMRLNQVGRGKPNYPDDESPASVARQAVIYGLVYVGAAVFGLLNSVLVLVASATLLWDWAADYELNIWLCAGAAAVIATAPTALRCRQINRYYAERYPESLNRWFFRPGFDPVRSDSLRGDVTSDGAEASNPAEAISKGNPAVIAPEVMAALTRLERNQVAGRFARRMSLAGAGNARYPDDEPAASVARDALGRGVSSAGWLLTLPVLMAMGYVNAALLVDGSAVGAVGSAICIVLLLVAVVLVRRRRRRIVRLLDEQAPYG